MGVGVSQINGQDQINENSVKKLFDYNEDFKEMEKYESGALSSYSIYPKQHPLKEKVKEILQKGEIAGDIKFDRAMASFLSNVIGDALGAPYEFSYLRYDKSDMRDGFSETYIWETKTYNRFSLKPGQWTDDASMGLCIADSLISCQSFNPKDLRLRFLLWWRMGYCNAFGYDDERDNKNSVGLGGNISLSMREFLIEKNEYTQEGDKYTSGNGSIMRNGAIPLFYAKNEKDADTYSKKQSETTHQGIEAADCCRLLTHIVLKALNGNGTKDILEDLTDFSSKPDVYYSVKCLAESKCEKKCEFNKDLDLNDRKWNWKDEKFRYSESRANQDPGYIGSYAMDAMSMALHCVWTTNSYKEAMLKCANMRGDSDSVCAVVGQIAGAIYGLKAIPKDWIEAILKWDPNYDIPLRAYLLYTHEKI